MAGSLLRVAILAPGSPHGLARHVTLRRNVASTQRFPLRHHAGVLFRIQALLHEKTQTQTRLATLARATVAPPPILVMETVLPAFHRTRAFFYATSTRDSLGSRS